MELEDWLMQDIHCVASLVKLFCRELPAPGILPEAAGPLLREAAAVAEANSDSREALDSFRKAVYTLDRLQYRYFYIYLLICFCRASLKVLRF